MRNSEEPVQEAYAEGKVYQLHANVYHQKSEILGKRIDKIPDRNRPQYTPELRFSILQLKKIMAWSWKETATHFRIPPAHHDAVQPPRGQPGEGSHETPFEITFLDPERKLPLLIRKAA